MKSGGLKLRLIKLQLTLSITILTISWIVITVNDYFHFKELSLQNFETTARVLSRNLTACLDFQDKDECQRVLGTLSGERDVLKAQIFNEKDELVSIFQKPGVEIPEQKLNSLGQGFQFQILNGMIYSTYPIIDSSNFLGKLFIVYEFDLLSNFLKTHAIFFFFVMFGSGLVGIFLSTHLQKKITFQLNTILVTINKIRTQKNYKLRTLNEFASGEVEINEFKQLAISFDDMIEQIEIKDASLRMRNEDLKKLVEEKVQELYKEKEKAIHNAELASLGEMAGGIAHEINNPLAIIKSTTATLNKLLSKDKFNKEIFIDCITDIDTTVERMAKIVNGLRNISRRTEDEEKVLTTFGEIFDDVFGVAAVRSNAKGVEIRKNYPEEYLNRTFRINRIQISQVLVNLLNNSFDAICEKEEKWIEVQLEFSEKLIVLKVTDSGNGIPQKVRDKMFNPFYTTKEIGKGTGIGLSISKSLIEKNGGQFYYDEHSSHTRFTIQIPIETENS